MSAPAARPFIPFIPLWIDRADLTPIQFRLLAHLWCRAGKTCRCWPGANAIKRDCRISDDALWPAIKALEGKGFLRRVKHRYNSNEYLLTVPGVTGSNPVTLLQAQSGEPSPGSAGEELPVKIGEELPGKAGCKGIPEKVLHEGLSSEGVGAHTPFALSAVERSEIRDEFRIDAAAVAEAERVYTENKAAFVRQDGPLCLAGFRGWLRTSKDGKRIIAAAAARSAGDDWEIEANRWDTTPLDEPDGWRERLAKDSSIDQFYFTAQWGDRAFHNGIKRYIIKAASEANHA